MITEVADVKPTVTGMEMKSIRTPVMKKSTMDLTIGGNWKEVRSKNNQRTVEFLHIYKMIQSYDFLEIRALLGLNTL